MFPDGGPSCHREARCRWNTRRRCHIGPSACGGPWSATLKKRHTEVEWTHCDERVLVLDEERERARRARQHRRAPCGYHWCDGRRGRERERGARWRRAAHGGGRPLAQHGRGRSVRVRMSFVRRPVGDGLPARVADVEGGGVVRKWVERSMRTGERGATHEGEHLQGVSASLGRGRPRTTVQRVQRQMHFLSSCCWANLYGSSFGERGA